jgi:murein DD-endopeptidase MepM/ murein hydrolase activator NlpD
MAIALSSSLTRMSSSVRPTLTGKRMRSPSLEAIKNIQGTFIKKGKVRREILEKQNVLKNRRLEKERRKRQEDELEASNVVARPDGPFEVTQKSNKGFLERILGFLGYLGAGWLLNNLPTLIAMGKEFVGRVQRMGQLIGSFVTNITNILTGFGNLLSATFQNLIQFDLFDTSNRVKNAFGQLTGSVDDMGRELEEALKLITTPLTEGMVTGEDAPPTGQERTSEGAYERGAPLQTGGSPSGLFELIAGGEGGYESMNRGNAGDSPGGSKKYLGKNLQDMTLSEIMSLQSQGKVFAVGKYQIVTGTMPGFVRWLQSKGYDPKTTKYSAKIQDLYPQYTIESKRPQVGKFLSGSMNDIQKANLELAAEFASVGVPFDMKAGSYGGGYPIRDIKKGESLYSGKARNRASISPEKVQQALREAKASGGNITPSSSQAQITPMRGGVSTTVRDEINVAGRSGGTALVGLTPGGGRYGAARRGGRVHKGVDIGTNKQRGYYVAFRQSGTVSYARNNGRGYGNLVIIKSGNIEFYFAHLASILVQEGQKYNGETIGEIGKTGGDYDIHLHYEVRPGGNPIDPSPYLGLLSIGRQLTGVSGREMNVPIPSAPTTPAQIASIQSQQQTQQRNQQLSQDRTGPTVIVQEPSEPESQAPSYSGGGSPGMMPLEIDEFTLVNRFIKNKLLLDLAYL